MKLTKSQLRSRASITWTFSCSSCGNEEQVPEGGSPQGWEFEVDDVAESLCPQCSGNHSWLPELVIEDGGFELELGPWIEWDGEEG